nr:hypothetical protein [Paracraurococcus ruber]
MQADGQPQPPGQHVGGAQHDPRLAGDGQRGEQCRPGIEQVQDPEQQGRDREGEQAPAQPLGEAEADGAEQHLLVDRGGERHGRDRRQRRARPQSRDAQAAEQRDQPHAGAEQRGTGQDADQRLSRPARAEPQFRIGFAFDPALEAPVQEPCDAHRQEGPGEQQGGGGILQRLGDRVGQQQAGHADERDAEDQQDQREGDDPPQQAGGRVRLGWVLGGLVHGGVLRRHGARVRRRSPAAAARLTIR